MTKELEMNNGEITDAERVASECYIDGCSAPVFESDRVGLKQYYECGHGHRFTTASAGDEHTFSDGHRLAGAKPTEQAGPTDEDGDGYLWDWEEGHCPACNDDLDGTTCPTCGLETSE